MSMKTEKVHHVLDALRRERLSALTKDALVKAFNDDGIHDLEGLAEHVVRRIKTDLDVQKTEPRLIDLAPLGRRTLEDIARGIVHAVPEIPFILGGVAYDPKDIHRFDGQALVFIPVVGADGGEWLQVFPDDIGPALAGYFQARMIEKLLEPTVLKPTELFPPQTPPAGTPPGQPGDTPYPQLNPPGGSQPNPPHSTPTPAPRPQYPDPPITRDQVQMFDGGAYTGNWFWLARGFMYADLTQVSRGGLFGGDWNDEIWSLSSTNTSCIYCEHVQLQGSKLLLGPNRGVPLLSALGWSARISSVWNFDF